MPRLAISIKYNRVICVSNYLQTSPLSSSRQYNISPRVLKKASPTNIRTYSKKHSSSLLQDISPSLINATVSPNRNEFKRPRKFDLSVAVSPEKIGFPNTGEFYVIHNGIR